MSRPPEPLRPEMRLKLTGSSPNFSQWQVYINDQEITKDVVGLMIELTRGCLPLVTLQCTARLQLPEHFNALVEAPERLYS